MKYTLNQEYVKLAEIFPLTNLKNDLESPVLVISNCLPKRITRQTYMRVHNEGHSGKANTRATVYDLNGVGGKVAEDYRKTDMFSGDLMEDKLVAYTKLNKLIRDAALNKWGIEDIAPISPWWLAGYGVNDKFDLHCDGAIRLPDGTYKPMENRILSAILYLNTKDSNITGWGYTGGSLIFPGILDETGEALTIEPKEGDLVIFPSNWIYSHKVTEITAGYRVAATNFFEQV